MPRLILLQWPCTVTRTGSNSKSMFPLATITQLISLRPDIRAWHAAAAAESNRAETQCSAARRKIDLYILYVWHILGQFKEPGDQKSPNKRAVFNPWTDLNRFCWTLLSDECVRLFFCVTATLFFFFFFFTTPFKAVNETSEVSRGWLNIGKRLIRLWDELYVIRCSSWHHDVPTNNVDVLLMSRLSSSSVNLPCP